LTSTASKCRAVPRQPLVGREARRGTTRRRTPGRPS
jgi:hypothetical protein